MSAHQLIHENNLKFTNYEAWKEHNKGVAANGKGFTAIRSVSKGQPGRASGGSPIVTYKKNAPAPAPPPPPAAPAPKVQAPKPKAAVKAPEVEYSPEIQQAKERVKTYEDDITSGKTSESIYDVGSNKFNKNSDSFLNSKQFDFSSKSFESNKSAEPTEQAQAAQNQLQNYLTKYSKYKSDN